MKKLQQTGSALIVSLVMLTSVTFLAVLSLQSSTTQVRIVSNLQIKEDLFHTAKRELGRQYDGYRDDMDKMDELADAFETSAAGQANALVPEIPLDQTNVSAVNSTSSSVYTSATEFHLCPKQQYRCTRYHEL